MTAKAEHRAALEAELVRLRVRPACALRHRGGCRGRLHADHIVELDWLREWFRRSAARMPYRLAPATLHVGVGALSGDLEAEFSDDPDAILEHVAADPRNGWLICDGHHGQKTTGLIFPPITRNELPPTLWPFCTDYRCEHLLSGRAAFAI